MTDTPTTDAASTPQQRRRRVPSKQRGGDAQAQAKLDNVIALRSGRDRQHPHPVRGEGDLKRYRTPEDDYNLVRHFDDRRRRFHRDALVRSLELLPDDMRRAEVDIFDDMVEAAGTLAPQAVVEAGPASIERWAADQSHRVMAAAILSVSGSQAEAALHAGVATATVARYMRDPEFTAYVNAERRRLLSRVQGGVLAELERRVFSGDMLMMPVKDVLDILKVTGDLGGSEVVSKPTSTTAAGRGGDNGPSVTIYNQLAAIAAPAPVGAVAGRSAPESDQLDRGRVIEGTFTTTEDADFPVLGVGGDPVAEEVPPIDG